jgi:archaemetzincin
MKKIFFSFLVVILVSCQPEDRIPGSSQKISKNETSVMVLPLGKTTPQFISETFAAMKKVLPDVVLLNKEEMPRSAYYAPRKRYRADTLIHWMSNRAKKGEVYVGITMQDISTTNGDNPDYGVMGLGFNPGDACVASSYRLKNKKYFIRVVVHELGHTAGLPHCPDKTCYMRDAEGGDHTANEKGFCEKCKVYLKERGWKL